MPYAVNYSPAPLTLNIRPRLNWRLFLTVAWLGFIAYQTLLVNRRKVGSYNVFDIVILIGISTVILLSFLRRERIEIYPDQMVWRTTYFGVTRSKAAPLADVLGAEWNEGEQPGRYGKGQDYVEFYFRAGSIKACYGFTFDEFDKMREDIRAMYPDLIKRWGHSPARSKDLTLLNLS